MSRGKSRKTFEQIVAYHEILAEIQPATFARCAIAYLRWGFLPDMSKSSTNGVSKQLVYARETGFIPWSWVVDETRKTERVSAWDDPNGTR